MGSIHWRFRHWQTAPIGLLAVLLTAASGLSPLRADNADDAAGQGNNAFKSNNLDQAIAGYTDAIRLNPNDAVTYATRGMTYQRKGDYDHAIADYSQCIRLNPELQNGYVYRGLVYDLKGDHSRAIADFSHAIRVNPDAAVAYADRALSYAESGNPKKAVSDLHEAIYINPDYAMAYNNLAWILATCPNASVRNGSDAVKAAEKAAKLTNWHPSPIFDTLAAAYAEAGNFDEAVKWEKWYLRLNLAKRQADGGRRRLGLYEQKQPYREQLTRDEKP